MNAVFDARQLALAMEKLSPGKLEHSLRVGETAARQGPSYATVGLLHDMLEDSDVTLDELRAAGVTEAELAAIRRLTRGGESYEVYIAGIVRSQDRVALSVKICDLLDHLDPSIAAGLTMEKQAKYLGALPHVLDALRALGNQGVE